ncbi:uncharacterized protein LOC135218147 isoform X2 [Macrobrachium nipponense]|uniref:uncharacterized protein LOC135218147 isoform X2 n=1 Tax=Macrobrachium nipponense TaxID=159736 RepID=UPI0030C7E977
MTWTCDLKFAFLLAVVIQMGICQHERVQGPRRGITRKPFNEEPDEKPSCSPKPVAVDWDVVKHRVISMVGNDHVYKEDLLHSRSPGSVLPVEWCRSETTPCGMPATQCSLGPMESKSTAFAVSTAKEERLLVSLDYLEATRCLCRANTSVVDVFPIITKVNVAKQCNHVVGGLSNSAVVGTGRDATMSFPYSTPVEEDAPSSVMILKAFEQTRPLIIDFMIKIKNTQSYDGPEDWRVRASVSFDMGVVELLLPNVGQGDEGPYLCMVEFLSSSSCFSMVELSVSGSAQDTEQTVCRPQMTKPTWATFQDGAPMPVVFSSNFNQNLLVQKCGALGGNQCQAASRQCVSSTTREKETTLCVPDDVAGDHLSKMAVRYIEDETCACGPREVFQKSSISGETVHITNLKKVGTCPRGCQPEYVVVQWRDLKEYLNKWTTLSLNASIEGQTLKVKKCHESLTPCSDHNVFCEVAEEMKTRKRIKLKNVNLKINLKIVEASRCECKERENPTQDGFGRVDRPPVITYAKLGHLRTKKSGEKLRASSGDDRGHHPSESMKKGNKK